MSSFASRGALATSPGRVPFPEILLDNMLMESPIHSIDLLRVFASSEVAEVHSVVRRAYSPYKDVHGALILFENGCLGHLISNYTTDSRLQRYEIHGRDISAYLEGINQGTVFCDGEQHELRELGTGGRREDIRYFLDCHQRGPADLAAASQPRRGHQDDGAGGSHHGRTTRRPATGLSTYGESPARRVRMMLRQLRVVAIWGLGLLAAFFLVSLVQGLGGNGQSQAVAPVSDEGSVAPALPVAAVPAPPAFSGPPGPRRRRP